MTNACEHLLRSCVSPSQLRGVARLHNQEDKPLRCLLHRTETAVCCRTQSSGWGLFCAKAGWFRFRVWHYTVPTLSIAIRMLHFRTCPTYFGLPLCLCWFVNMNVKLKVYCNIVRSSMVVKENHKRKQLTTPTCSFLSKYY